jgi:hypothetical protein
MKRLLPFALILAIVLAGCSTGTITDVAGKDVAFVNDMMAARGEGDQADVYWKLRLLSIDGRAPKRAFRDEKAILPSAVIPAGRHEVVVEVTRLSLTNSKDRRTERLTFPVTAQKGKNYLLTIQRGFPAIVEDTR